MNQEVVNKQLIVELERNIQKNYELDDKLKNIEVELETYKKMEDNENKALKTGYKFYNSEMGKDMRKDIGDIPSKANKTGSKFYNTKTSFGTFGKDLNVSLR